MYLRFFLNSQRIKRPKPLLKQACSRESFKEGMLDDMVRKPVVPTFWVEKPLAVYLLEFSFHFQRFPFGLY